MRTHSKWKWWLAPAVWSLAAQVSADVPVFSYRVINTFPHDASAFTQGLVYDDGNLYEGTGRNGQSRLSRVDLATGKAEQTVRLADRYFGEGIEIVGDRVFQLTWQSHMVFVYNKADLSPAGNHFNPFEGWGLAWDGERLILSDGSATLRFFDPDSFTLLGDLDVTLDGEPLTRLNELEYIDGEVWANIWQTDYIARIDPNSGVVMALINLEGLGPLPSRVGTDAVLNGIAHDAEGDRLFVTGKLWPSLFEIELVAP